MPLTVKQEQYLSALLDKSEEDLLLELSRNIIHNRITIYNVMAKKMLSRTYNLSDSSHEKASSEEQLREDKAGAEHKEEWQKELAGWVPSDIIEEEDKQRYFPSLPNAEAILDTMHAKLYSKMCDATICKPQSWAIDAVTGQVKDVVAGAITVMTAQYNIEMALAIPIAVLLLKNGLSNFCCNAPLTGSIIEVVNTPLNSSPHSTPPPLSSSRSSSFLPYVAWIICGLVVLGLILINIFWL